jgi:tol-pal system protein YbgF
MKFRSITVSTLAVLLLSATAAMTSEGRPVLRADARAAAPHRAIGLPGVFDRSDEAPVVLAQANDPRITQLEEQIRKLSGTVEELNFQVLQMQEQLRKMQEDNEFRFQELEKRGEAGAAANKKTEATQPRVKDTTTADNGTRASDGAVGTVTPDDGTTPPAATDSQDPALGTPPVDLGEVTVDKNGNIKGTKVGEPLDPLAGSGNASDNTTVAALPATDDPSELYRNSYEFILSGDYSTAEAGFRDHIARFPSDPKASDAHYWLGESLLGQQKYRDAAEVFLAANRDYPDAAKAPDMLLKLGISLNGLQQREVACATYKEIGKRYPKSSDALKQRVKQEEALAAC